MAVSFEAETKVTPFRLVVPSRTVAPLTKFVPLSVIVAFVLLAALLGLIVVTTGAGNVTVTELASVVEELSGFVTVTL